MTERDSVASARVPDEDPLLGQVIDGRFEVQSLIARGGMGRVYRAVQAPLGRVCALKVVNATLAGADPEYERRFTLEASTAAKLTHPNTVTVFDYGKTEDGTYFMAMELLEGRTLHRLIRDEGPLSPERAIRITQQICRSLREAHAFGVIHRDLKPANVFLVAHGDERDFVKVLDFGLVKSIDDRPEEQLTQTGIFMGSPKYMSPEQIEGQKVDARTDLYAMGIILFEMLTGKVPFDKATSVKTLMAQVHEAPPSFASLAPALSFPEGLEETVARCIEKEPAQRFASMDALLDALRDGVPSLVPSSLQRMRSSDSPPSNSEVLARTRPLVSGPQSSGAMSPVSQPPSSQLEAPPRRWPLFAVVLAAAIGGGVTMGYVAQRLRAPEVVAQGAAAMSVPPPAPAVGIDPASLPAAAGDDERRDVRITSAPEGATITGDDGAVLCAATPCTLSLEAHERAATRELTVSRDGYRSLQITSDFSAPRAFVLTPSTALATAPTGRPAGNKPAGGKPASKPSAPKTPAAPSGFKDVPY